MAEEALPVEEATVVDPPVVHTLDAHMAPYLDRLGTIGTVTIADLRGFYSALRSAFLAHLSSPTYEEPVTETLEAPPAGESSEDLSTAKLF